MSLFDYGLPKDLRHFAASRRGALKGVGTDAAELCGGGAFVGAGSALPSSTTLAANSSTGDAGAVDVNAIASTERATSDRRRDIFFDDTIVYNIASNGKRGTDYVAAGVHVDGTARIELSGVLIAGNRYGATASDFSTIASRPPVEIGHDLIGVPHSVNVPPNTLVGFCPSLAPLADNGGFVTTHKLHSQSPAIDSGAHDLDASKDERGRTACVERAAGHRPLRAAKHRRHL